MTDTSNLMCEEGSSPGNPCSKAKSTSPTVDLGPKLWGEIYVGDQKYKDCKVWPEGSAEWDWRKTGTKHSPGVQPDDLKEILLKGVDTLIISQGMLGQLEVPDSTVEYAKKEVKEVIVCLTEEAVKKYNELASEGKRIGGIFHSTC